MVLIVVLVVGEGVGDIVEGGVGDNEGGRVGDNVVGDGVVLGAGVGLLVLGACVISGENVTSTGTGVGLTVLGICALSGESVSSETGVGLVVLG